MKHLFRERIQRVQSMLREKGVRGALFTDDVSVRTLIGRASEDGQLLVELERVTFFVHGLSSLFLDSDLRIIRLEKEIFRSAICACIENRGRLVVSSESMSVAAFQQLQKLVRQCGGSLRAVSGVLQDIRAIKSSVEIQAHTRASQIADDALAVVRTQAREGMSEARIAALLESEMRRLGSACPAFPTIVAFSEHASIPHHTPSESRMLQRSDLVLIDMGAVVDGCHSDMTRTFLPENAPKAWEDVYRTVLVAQQAGVQVVRPGVPVGDVDAACREVIEKDGYADQFVHSTGHGVGYEIHEFPAVAKGVREVLQSNMIITVEPGVYLQGKMGVRIEDMGVVEERGYTILTNTSKQMEPFLL